MYFLIWSSGSSGRTHTWFCGLLQYLSLYGTGVAYVITTATSMRYYRQLRLEDSRILCICFLPLRIFIYLLEMHQKVYIILYYTVLSFFSPSPPQVMLAILSTPPSSLPFYLTQVGKAHSLYFSYLFFLSFCCYINAEQFRNQTVITKKGIRLHVHMGIIYICCSLGLFRSSCRRFQISTTWNGSPSLLQSCPFPTLSLDLHLGLQK